MFIVKSDGKIDFVSDNVKDFLGFPQDALTDKVIYNYIHQGDHARFSVNLEPDTWKTWKRIPQNKSGRQVFDRSKVFHLRFRLNNAVKSEDEVQRLDSDYENLQVSAIVMLNPIEEQGETPKSGLFCIARKINPNEGSELTPVEQFTTKANPDNFVITTVDTSGLPELYVKNIESQVLGKTLLSLVHPHDEPLLREHIHTLLISESDTSKAYRMVLPPPHNVVHVKTKSRIFTPQPGFKVAGYIMSTHAIIRENELKEDDLPGLRPQLRGIGSEKLSIEQMVMDGQQSKVSRVNSPQVQSPPIGASQDKRQGSQPPPKLRSVPVIASSMVPSSSPSSAASSSFSSDKTELFNQLLSPASSHSNGPSSKVHFPSHHNVPATSPSNGGNELLKELLKPKEDKSRDTGSENWGTMAHSSPQQSSSSSDNVTLVGLLNERPKQQEQTSELLKQLRAPPRSSPTNTRLAQLLQGHKRPSSSDEGPANKQPPSLEKLLESRPDSRPIPPLPRKWSEVPQDKLPRDIVIDNRPPNNRNNNAGRSRVLSSTFPSSGSPPVSVVSNVKASTAGLQSRIVQNTRPSPMEGNKSSTASESVPTNFSDPSFNDASEFRDLMTDPVFSKILDNILVEDTDNNDQRKQQKIQRIEEELMGYEQLEQTMTPAVGNLSSGTNLPPGLPMVVQSSNQTRVVVTSVGGTGPAQYAQPGVIRQQSAPPGRQQILQQRGPQGNDYYFPLEEVGTFISFFRCLIKVAPSSVSPPPAQDLWEVDDHRLPQFSRGPPSERPWRTC